MLRQVQISAKPPVKKCLRVADELGYVPHALAQSLAKGRSNNIGLFLVQPHPQVFADPYIPNIITGIRNAIQEDGFRILVEQIRSAQDSNTLLTMLKSGEIAGAIVTHNIWQPEHIQATTRSTDRIPHSTRRLTA